ncbi:hypothetical protein FOMPIDRAFT_1101569, partial [Fomitopsis schrenkii]
YMSIKFKASEEKIQDIIDNTAKTFMLNSEPEHAFRIVANHASEPQGEKLKMYLGGMAGTGKSQVIKTLIHFFNTRNEGYRFICMARTGSAASLISGSTYHSMLGFSKYGESSDNSLRDVRDHVNDVDYMFIDEISMVDCNHFYDISARLC